MSYIGWTIAAASVLGAGYSVYAGERGASQANKQASKQRKIQAQQIATEQERYESEITRQEEAQARQYEAAMGDYEQSTANLEAWKENWSAMAEDPRGQHPGWPSFETAVTEAAESQMSQVADIYQRRGKASSGEYLRAVQDIESGRQETLQDALMGITREARGKMFEIDAAMPSRPVLGAAHMYQPPQDYGFTPSPMQAIGDVGGLGQGLALALDRMKDRSKTSTSTTAALQTGVQSSQQWQVPGAGSQYESIFGEQMAPQQSQYSLLG